LRESWNGSVLFLMPGRKGEGRGGIVLYSKNSTTTLS
jgi:hypothetical protein